MRKWRIATAVVALMFAMLFVIATPSAECRQFYRVYPACAMPYGTRCYAAPRMVLDPWSQNAAIYATDLNSIAVQPVGDARVSFLVQQATQAYSQACLNRAYGYTAIALQDQRIAIADLAQANHLIALDTMPQMQMRCW